MCGETSRGHPCPVGGLDQHGPRRLARQPPSARVQEQRAGALRRCRRWPAPGRRAGEIGVDGRQGVGADRDDPLLAALAAQQHGGRPPGRGRRRRVPRPRRSGRRCRTAPRAGPGRGGRAWCRPPRRPRGSPRRPPAAAPWAAAAPATGGRTPAAGSPVASPSATQNLWKPRTATTVRPAEVARQRLVVGRHPRAAASGTPRPSARRSRRASVTP